MVLSYDYEFTLERAVGSAGITETAFQVGLEQLAKAHTIVQEGKSADHARRTLGFTKLPYANISAIEELATAVRSEIEALIVVGIGGSDLGTRAVHRALNHQFFNMLPAEKRGGPRLFFVGDTTDPIALQEVMDVVDMSKTCVTIVSKSGNTIEQMSTFLTLRQKLIEAVGEEMTVQRIVIITDENTGTLRDMVRQDGYRSLIVPADVGGRFSVLSTVGLFPLAVVGVDIRQLLAGAAHMDEADSSLPFAENPAALYALTQFLAYTKGQQISVLMPYTYGLREVGFWYRQLWAESLGKAKNLSGETVHTGPTPIAAVGPTDQHSQLQLYTEGPFDKVVTFVTVAQPATDVMVPAAYPNLEGAGYLAGQSLARVVAAEADSTALALKQSGRPSGRFTMASLDAFHLGALLYSFELSVSYAGALLNVNTYDQPGVELSKQLMYGILGREGYEAVTMDTAGHAVASI